MHRSLFTLLALLTLLSLPFAPGSSRAAVGTGVAEVQPLFEQDAIFNNDAQSTSGPVPPPEVSIQGSHAPSSQAKIIAGVPAYIWRHGCGPTAAGMLIGYWDSQGYGWLIPGDASTQSSAVNEVLASSEGLASHYNDYAWPEDHYPEGPKPDRSEAPVGDEHPSDSLADFMHTSWSSEGNYYGWSWFSDVAPALKGYTDLVQPAGYRAVTENLYMLDGSFNWDRYKDEINANRPLILLVDTEGDGATDHLITAIGYDIVNGARMYAAYNTWDRQLHWYDFQQIGKGKAWGIYGAVTLQFQPVGLDTTLDICLENEPETLYPYSEKLDFSAWMVLSAIYDGPVDRLASTYQPVILQELPDLENGQVVTQTVRVKTGDPVVNDAGEVVTLEPGIVVRPAGCRSSACAVRTTETAVEMERFAITYHLLSGLSWSDRRQLSASDSVYAYRLSAASQTTNSWTGDKFRLERTASYISKTPTQAVWTGLPGFVPEDFSKFFWSPLPEHAWSNFSTGELSGAHLSNRQPLGWGPYRIESWAPGGPIIMGKNPAYFRAREGLPRFEKLVYHFYANPLAGILSGDCDILPKASEDLSVLEKYDRQGWLKVITVKQTSRVGFSLNVQAGQALNSQLRVAVVSPQISGFALDAEEWKLWNIETLNLGVEASLSLTGGSVSADDGVRYEFSQGVLPKPVTFTHIPRSPVNLPTIHGLVGAGHYFENFATGPSGEKVQPTQPYLLTISYSDDELYEVRESSLALYFWNGDDWVREPTSWVDPERNQITATPYHFGIWAVLGEKILYLFLPVVRTH